MKVFQKIVKGLQAKRLQQVTSVISSRGQQAQAAVTGNDVIKKPGYGHDLETCDARRTWLEAVTGTSLKTIGTWWGHDTPADPTIVRRNCETPIGTVKIPVGVIGPMNINFEGADGPEEVFAPFATVEGSLIASTCRGAKVISMAGGVHTSAVDQRMARAPCFICSTPAEAARLGRWIEKNEELFREIAESNTSHGKLLKVLAFPHGSGCHVRFEYNTGDASGQNMVTICTAPCMQYITENAKRETGVDIQHHYVATGFDGDKRTGAALSLLGRGHHVTAHVDLSDELLQKMFRTDSKEIMSYWVPHQGGIMARGGVCANNFNISNIVAGIFASTGQDLGAVPESSHAHTTLIPIYSESDGSCMQGMGTVVYNQRESGLRMEVVFPSMTLGTVGGGTGLPTQAESLRVMGCEGSGKAPRLAQIVAAFSLAQDLSMMAAIVSNEFTQAHINFARQ